MTTEDLRRLKEKALDIRRLTVEEIAHLGIGHVGGCLSVTEILVLLYYRHMKHDPADPVREDRDKFVLSKGHAGPALYAVLADRGFFPKEMLYTLNQGGTNLPSHCDMNRTPGIDMTTGSLGQGLSAAVGMALGHRLKNLPGRIFALIGDGDTNEGQTWEAAMSASMYGLNNLVAFTDYNKMQIDGPSEKIMNLDHLEERWESFGWFTQRVDGHDLGALDEVLERACAEEKRPSMIIADTIKGKGIPHIENDYTNHNMPLTREDAEKVYAWLDRCESELEETNREVQP
ncbi:transketolase [Alkalispirochaeta americana]|uniref:Transketolase n=1 Tax=Alkalispirochaeta americana TaxID=159291 RepID=A0A1N6VEI2_9SPIO|nr:transketolase [Alkalispirochaeta americana]SIQ76261.1 transketolase [Alkalispirochaeta americana]